MDFSPGQSETTAKALGLNLRPVLQAPTFSLLISAVESGTAAAFLPEVAARSLPEQNFALVSAEGMGALTRRLSLHLDSQVLESRPPSAAPSPASDASSPNPI